jgi:cytochrome oxidase assembly protein ShyY1
VAAALLGRWQWDRTQDILAAERAALSQAIPVEQAVDPQGSVTLPPESIGRPVLLAGEYVPDLQVAVTNREHEGQPGVWIVTGLRLPTAGWRPCCGGGYRMPRPPGRRHRWATSW